MIEVWRMRHEEHDSQRWYEDRHGPIHTIYRWWFYAGLTFFMGLLWRARLEISLLMLIGTLFVSFAVIFWEGLFPFALSFLYTIRRKHMFRWIGFLFKFLQKHTDFLVTLSNKKSLSWNKALLWMFSSCWNKVSFHL